MSEKITAQALGGETVPNLEVATVQEAFDKLGLDGSYSATVNGEPADMEDEVEDYAFVSFSPSVKGGAPQNPNPPTPERVAPAFAVSLKRNNEAIKGDRAAAITEDTQLVYKRQIEDLGMELKKLHRQQENALDLSPNHADDLILAKNFDCESYVNKDVEVAVKINKTQIRLDIAVKRFDYLFGEIKV